MAEARIWLTSDQGEKISLLDNATKFKYVKNINDVGSFYIYMPADIRKTFIEQETLTPGTRQGEEGQYPTIQSGVARNFLRVDRMVQFWPLKNGVHRFDFLGFLRIWGYRTDDNGLTLSRLGGPDQNGLLRHRIVAYPSGDVNAESLSSLAADNVMKDVFSQNFLSDATDSDRDISSLGVTVAPDLSAGPSQDKEFAWRRVLDVLQDINEASRAKDNEVFFSLAVTGVAGGGAPRFQFKTYTGQPGQNRTVGSSDDPIIVSLEMGNLASPDLEYDWSEAENYIYAGGQDTGASRNIQEVYDQDAINQSVWNRYEGFAQAASESTNAGVQDAGYTRLGKKEAKARFKGYILSSKQTPYGDWELGTRVTVLYQGERIDGVVRRVEVEGDHSQGLTARGYIEERL